MGVLYSCFTKEDPTQMKDKPKEVDQKDITVLKLKTVQDRLLAQKKGLQKNVDKAQAEAKQFVANKNKERAVFALKRKKLYETYLTDTENQYAIVQKSILDVESAIMTSTYVEVLKDTNDLIKEIEKAGALEKLQEIGEDMREREQQTREFNRMFEEHHVDDVEEFYKQFEQEVEDEDALNLVGLPQRQQQVTKPQEPVVQQTHARQEEQEEEQEEEEKNTHEKLLALA
jgi:hypothetical protein